MFIKSPKSVCLGKTFDDPDITKYSDNKYSKYILAGGCSFTQSYLDSPACPDVNTDFSRWPELLGQKLGLNVKNLARSGMGNDWIYKKVSRDLLSNHEQIELVVVGWSDPTRYDLWGIEFTPLNDVYNKMSDKDKLHWAKPGGHNVLDEAALNFHDAFYQTYLWDEWDVSRPGQLPVGNIIAKQILETFAYMLDLQRLCEALNKPLIMSSMLGKLDPQQIHYQMKTSNNRPDLLQKFDYKELISYLSNSEYLLGINQKYCIGYPFIQVLGGFDFHHCIITNDSEYQICPEDPHPNEKGHALIAEMYYEHYKKHY